ncbi:GH22448 [Drosophila grimshawi]|uniref:GH22448 n=1 Tax=Drosophila grimshawi TaxID=7222 RepID=B4K103_DROGR|nr:GH22448 [Drosophila grimshawi]
MTLMLLLLMLLRFKSQVSDYADSLTALVSPTITDSQPGIPIDIQNWNIPPNIRMADPVFYKAHRVDLLIGASMFFDLLCVGQIRFVPGLPLLLLLLLQTPK